MKVATNTNDASSSLFKSDQVQLVVLLERLLERDAIATTTLTQLDNCYHFAVKNAEVS